MNGLLPAFLDVKAWRYGSLNSPILQPDGQWDAYLPKPEDQLENAYDPQDCVSCAYTACQETLQRRLYGDQVDFSERFLAQISGTGPRQGNDLHTVSEIARNIGLVFEDSWPSKDIPRDLFYRQVPTPLYAEARKDHDAFERAHEWLPPISTIVKEALTHSPLAAPTYAWVEENGLFVKPKGVKDNHCVMIYGYTEDYVKVFDSTALTYKKVSWDAFTQDMKSFSITPRATYNQQLGLFAQILRLITNYLAQLRMPPADMPVEPPKIVQEQPLPAAPTPAPSVSDPAPEAKYDWSTPQKAKHSVRVICDEEGLTVQQKNQLCATVGAESGWQSYYVTGPKKGQPVINQNTKNGKIWSTDYGICQVNDFYNIGPGKPFSSVQFVLANPEACIRWMCREWKTGHSSKWNAFTSGLYRDYL